MKSDANDICSPDADDELVMLQYTDLVCEDLFVYFDYLIGFFM